MSLIINYCVCTRLHFLYSVSSSSLHCYVSVHGFLISVLSISCHLINLAPLPYYDLTESIASTQPSEQSFKNTRQNPVIPQFKKASVTLWCLRIRSRLLRMTRKPVTKSPLPSLPDSPPAILYSLNIVEGSFSPSFP